MAFPSSIDSFTAPSGTSTLVSPDHANLHATAGSAITSIETKLGLGVGSASANQVLVGSGAGTSAWGSVVNNLNLGTPAITGGTYNTPVIGTMNATGGTINTAVFNGGTSGTLVNTGGFSLKDNGSITQTGTSDHITLTPGANKLVRLAVASQGTGGANSYQNNAVVQMGSISFGTAASGGTIVGTVTFGVNFTTTPVVCANASGGAGSVASDTAFGIGIESIGTSSFVIAARNNGNNSSGTVLFNWIAIGQL